MKATIKFLFLIAFFLKTHIALSKELISQNLDFQIQGIWVAFATKDQALNEECNKGTTTFKFDENKIYMLPNNGTLKILAENYSTNKKNNNFTVNINNSSLSRKAKIESIIIDKNHFYITQVYDFDNNKFNSTLNNYLFLKKCEK